MEEGRIKRVRRWKDSGQVMKGVKGEGLGSKHL